MENWYWILLGPLAVSQIFKSKSVFYKFYVKFTEHEFYLEYTGDCPGPTLIEPPSLHLKFHYSHSGKFPMIRLNKSYSSFLRIVLSMSIFSMVVRLPSLHSKKDLFV